MATEADLPRVAELRRQAQAEVTAQERGGPLFLAREATTGEHVVVGTLDGVVVGFATALVESVGDGQQLGRIEELYVEPEARGVGVGEAVMGELLGWFRSHGCVGVDATALPGARATKNFFEASGFSARLLVMHHRLSPP